MTSVTLPTEWIIEACGGKKNQEMLPVITIDGTTIKVVIFPHGGAGMRSMMRNITQTRAVSFKVSIAMRGFFRLLSDFHQITLAIEDKELSVTAENPCSAVQYHFPNIELADDNVILDHVKDIHVVVPCAEWLTMWKSVPPKGNVTVVVDKKRRSVTLKHSKGRWAGAIQAREKPLETQTFGCDAMVAKRIFAYVVPQTTFCTVVLMHCGVLRWTDDHVTIYLAPDVEGGAT
jgi:hypothetical protein